MFIRFFWFCGLEVCLSPLSDVSVPYLFDYDMPSFLTKANVKALVLCERFFVHYTLGSPRCTRGLLRITHVVLPGYARGILRIIL